MASPVPRDDQRLLLQGVDWTGFQMLLDLRGDRGWRIAYLDGAVELSPSRGNGRIPDLLGRLVAHYCVERDIFVSPTGEWLLQRRLKKAGAEPDESFIFGRNPKRKQKPDLVIEVQWRRGDLNKLEIYRRLGVGEVWLWADDAITVHVLGPTGYAEHPHSACLPEIDLELLCKLCKHDTLNDAVRGLRAALAKRGSKSKPRN